MIDCVLAIVFWDGPLKKKKPLAGQRDKEERNYGNREGS